MRRSGLLFVAALCVGAVFISCDGSEELRNFVNDLVITAVYRGIEVVGEDGATGEGAFWENGRLVCIPGSTLRLKVVLENSRDTSYGFAFSGRDAGLVVQEDVYFEGVSAVYLTVKMPEEEKNLDITLRLIAAGGYKPPDAIYLPLTCASTNINFLYAAAYDSTAGAAKLLLCFDRNIPGFSKDDITINGAPANGELRETGAVSGIYELETGNISGTVTVEVDKRGYRITPSSLSTTVSSLEPVVFDGVKAADGAKGTETTTALTLFFENDIDGLSEADITLAAGDTGAEKGTLTPDGKGVYTLTVSGIRAEGYVAVAVSKAGYNFVPLFQMAEVFYAKPVAFTGLDPDGAAGTATTTKLTLTFDEDIDDLNKDDITLDADDTGATPGTLSGSGPTYTLDISGITAAGEITVTVSKSGYAISPSFKTAQVYPVPVWNGEPVPDAADNPSIKDKFGVNATGKAGVAAAFNELHAFIQAGGLSNQPKVIKLGDWIDLDGGITVNAYTGGGDFKYLSASEDTRLIVVGINSFNNMNNNGATPHVVFQFQNIPVKRRMNATNTNEGGYAESEMRKYLVKDDNVAGSGNFLAGLQAAGVPQDVLWAPVRYAANGGSTATNADVIEDLLWLPTAWEMFDSQSSSPSVETAGNQAWLDYYTEDAQRIKYGGNAAVFYWTASPSSADSYYFCTVYTTGIASKYGANNGEGGVVPAFCVK
jgi:hypothetical protein